MIPTTPPMNPSTMAAAASAAGQPFERSHAAGGPSTVVTISARATG